MSPSGLSRSEIIAGLQRTYNVSPEAAARAADRTIGITSKNIRNHRALTEVAQPSIGAVAREWTERQELAAEQNDAGISAPIRGRRTGDALWLELVSAPRTKKNHAATLGSQKSPMYKRYLAEVVEAIGTIRDALELPLPDRRPLGYNCRVLFYVDKWGERADRVGLEQGLYDALQAAGVVSDDWVFRQGDGTRVIAGQRARVELWISPVLA
jgi:hypothetical protein